MSFWQCVKDMFEYSKWGIALFITGLSIWLFFASPGSRMNILFLALVVVIAFFVVIYEKWSEIHKKDNSDN